MVSNMDRIENINEKINKHIDNLYEHAEKDMDNIIQLLILNKTAFDENSFRESLKKYLEKYHRILYSSFSNKVFEWSKTENNYTDNAIVNLSSMVNKIEINNFEKEDTILLKMLDHIQLAIHQVEMMELSDNKIEPYLSKSVSAFDKKITDQVKEVNNSISSQTKKINDLKNSVKITLSEIVASIHVPSFSSDFQVPVKFKGSFFSSFFVVVVSLDVVLSFGSLFPHAVRDRAKAPINTRLNNFFICFSSFLNIFII